MYSVFGYHYSVFDDITLYDVVTSEICRFSLPVVTFVIDYFSPDHVSLLSFFSAIQNLPLNLIWPRHGVSRDAKRQFLVREQRDSTSQHFSEKMFPKPVLFELAIDFQSVANVNWIAVFNEFLRISPCSGLRGFMVIDGKVFKIGEGKDGFIALSYNRRRGGKDLAG